MIQDLHGGYVVLPLAPIPHQTVTTVLNKQKCDITLRALGGDLYFSLSVNNETIAKTLLVNNYGVLPPFPNPHFKGRFVFVDKLGNSPPTYERLGERFECRYYPDM